MDKTFSQEAVDIFGQVIRPGDTFVYALSAGRAQVLDVFEFIDVYKAGGYYEEIKVHAKVIHSNTYRSKDPKISSLVHAYFNERAVKVELPEGFTGNREADHA